MNVWTATVCHIAPEIRIDKGGGEIGTTDVLGVARQKEAAQDLIRDHVDLFIDSELPEGLEFESWEDVVDYIDYYFKYEVEEHELIRD